MVAMPGGDEENNEENCGEVGTYLLLCITMARMMGYMMTWTTYGIRQQGGERIYAKNRRILGADERFGRANISEQKNRAVTFNRQQQKIVQDAIEREAKTLGQKIHAIAVGSNHVHMVVNCIDEPTGDITGRYKKAAIDALRANGFAGKVWTKGYDTRYCFDEESLRARIDYVQMHGRIKNNG